MPITQSGAKRLAAIAVASSFASLGIALGAAAPAMADPSPSPTPSPSATAESTSPTETVADATIELPGGTRVELAENATIPVAVSGEPNSEVVLNLVGASNQQPVDGASLTVTLDASGKGSGKLPVAAAEAGQYKVTDVEGLKQSASITLAAAESAEQETTAPESAEAESDKAETQESDKPGIRDDGLDAYYPELARTMFDADGDGTYRIGDPVAGGRATGAVPAGLEKYYAQQVDFSAENCTALGYRDYSDLIGRPAECGYMIVPVDAEAPEAGQNLAVAVMKVPAGTVAEDGTFTPNNDPQGSVMWNPGGPGGSGMTLSVAGALYEPDLSAKFDLIGFDPRGVGSSMPVSQCSSDEQLDADRESDAFSKDRDEAEEDLNEISKRFTEDCFANTGAAFGLDAEGRKDVIEHLGTWDAVGDLDVLRSVAGDEKLNFIGFSYGTRLGYVYAQKFQPSAGRLVLDGVVDPGDPVNVEGLKQLNAKSNNFANLEREAAADPGDEFTPDENDTIAQGAGFQDTFEQYALNCSQLGAENKTWGELWPEDFADSPIAGETFSCPLGNGSTDREALTTANAELLQGLQFANGGRGLPTGIEGDDRWVTFSDGRTGVIQALYSTSLWPTLNLALTELAAGDSAGGLMQLADQYNSRDPETGHYDPMLQAFTTIRCTDSNGSANPADIERLRKFAEAYDEAAPFQASTIAPGVSDYCDFWQFSGTLPQAEKLTKIPNVLVVSTSHDPATPYAAGPKLARLIDGTLLSVSGSSHTSYMAESECTDDTVNTFLIEGTVPKDGDFGPELDVPDTAVDDQGNTVTFTTECKVETFRSADFGITAAKALAGDKIGFTVSHQDSEAGYSLQLVGKGLDEQVADFTTDNGGNSTGVFTVPTSAKPAKYAVELRNADGAVVDTLDLTVESAEEPDTDGDNGEGEDNGRDGNLADTGSELSVGALGLAALLVTAGATALLTQRGRR